MIYARIIMCYSVVSILMFSTVQAAPRESLSALIKVGLANNPQRQALKFEVEAAANRVAPSGALPDPVLSVNFLNLPVTRPGFDQEPMSGRQFMLKQGLPFPGKRRLREQISETETALARDQYAEATNELVRRISRSYYDLLFTDEALATLARNQQLLREFLKVAEQKYAVGMGLQQDVLKAQVELSLMMERTINLRQQREGFEADLNLLLNRPVDQAVVLVQQKAFEPVSVSFEQLKTWAGKSRPLLKLWQDRLAESRHKVELARKNLLPDVNLTAAYTQRNILKNGTGGADFFTAGISMALPVYAGNKQKQVINERQLQRKSIEEQQIGVYRSVARNIDRILSELNKNADLIELYSTGIIPQANQALASTLTGYQTDKVDFLTLISSQMTLLNLELEYARLISMYRKNKIDLEFIVGRSLSGEQASGSSLQVGEQP